MSKDYTVVIEKDPRPDLYTAYYKELPGCVWCGPTMEEAKSGLEKVLEPYLQARRDHNIFIPEPTQEIGND